MSRSLARRLVGLLLVISVAVSVYLVFTYRQDILDWWRLRQYSPSQEVQALADNTTMVGRGKDLFYVSDPEINAREHFNQNCVDTSEQSIVLGCYRLQQIYLYNVTDPRLAGVKEVTAAHEMLHAAYERLNSADKVWLDDLLRVQIAAVKEQRFKDLIDLYNQQEPGELLNEMHSILGTEYRNLSPKLEDYFKRYFSNRLAVVGFSEAYEGVFTESKNRIASYDQQLNDLKARIDSNTAQIDQKKAELNTSSQQLEQLRSTNPIAYNQAVPSYNSMVRSFNNLVAATRALINQYNDLVKARNNEVAVQNDLYRSLDSNYQTVPVN